MIKMANTLRVKISVFIVNWFDKVNKTRGMVKKEEKMKGMIFRKRLIT